MLSPCLHVYVHVRIDLRLWCVHFCDYLAAAKLQLVLPSCEALVPKKPNSCLHTGIVTAIAIATVVVDQIDVDEGSTTGTEVLNSADHTIPWGSIGGRIFCGEGQITVGNTYGFQ